MAIHCYRCSTALPPGTRFCPPGTRFCPQCGTQFQQPVPADASAAPPTPAGQFVPPHQPYPPPAPGQFHPGFAPPPKKRNPVLVGCLAVLGFFIIIGIIGGIAGGGRNTGSDSSSPASSSSGTSDSSPASTPAEKPAPAAPDTGVTMANFSRLKTGMSYDQVKAILGKDGTELSSNDIAGYKNIMCQWDGDRFGGNMNAMFQNDNAPAIGLPPVLY